MLPIAFDREIMKYEESTEPETLAMLVGGNKYPETDSLLLLLDTYYCPRDPRIWCTHPLDSNLDLSHHSHEQLIQILGISQHWDDRSSFILAIQDVVSFSSPVLRRLGLKRNSRDVLRWDTGFVDRAPGEHAQDWPETGSCLLCGFYR